jgi:hypothetical protein
MLNEDFLESMVSPFQRSSFTKLFINDVYYGLYWMHEDMDKEFIRSRYENHKGNLYKCATGLAGLGYIDNNTETYKKLNITILNFVKYTYQKKMGN